MKVEVLISTMNQEDIYSLMSKMNIQTDAVVINQCEKNGYEEIEYKGKKIRIFNCAERGLSKSRNKAIKESKADICIIADDDMTYVDNYEKLIINGYLENKVADILAFYVADSNSKNMMRKKFKINYLTSMKLKSVQLTFKRNSICEKKVFFDNDFGTGTENYMGEENIFLFDCIKKKIKVYYIPSTIAKLNDDSESTWFEGYNRKYFNIKGKAYYRMSKKIFPLLVLQFAIRKRNIYKKENISLFNAIKYMFEKL